MHACIGASIYRAVIFPEATPPVVCVGLMYDLARLPALSLVLKQGYSSGLGFRV